MQESKINQPVNGFPVPDALMLKPTQSASRKLLLSIVPLTPAPITGPDAWIGWVRLITYGGLSAMSFNRARRLSYVFMAATGVSLMTSMAGEAYAPAGVQQ
jgi:hypothetical protein